MVLMLHLGLQRKNVLSEIVSLSKGAEITRGSADLMRGIVIFQGNRPIRVLKGLTYLARVCSAGGVVLHAHMYHALLLSLLVKLLVRHAAVPIVYTSHTSRVKGVRAWVISASRRLRACDILFYKSQHNRLNSNCAHVIPNPAPAPAFVRSSTTPSIRRFIAVGRLHPIKRPIELLLLLAPLLREGYSLAFVGDGELRAALDHEISKLGLEGKVELLGNRNDVLSLMTEADLFLSYSSWEGLPMSVLEAGSLGLPVLATPVGALPELLADRRGWVASDLEYFATLQSIVAAPHEARERGERLQSHIAANNGIDAVVSGHTKIYEKALNPTRMGNGEGDVS